MTAALDRAAAAASTLGADDYSDPEIVARAAVGAALDTAELTGTILTRWHQFVQTRTELPPMEFAEQFATDIVTTIMGADYTAPAWRRGDRVTMVDNTEMHGRILEVLFDGAMLTIKWYGGDVVTWTSDKVRRP